MDVLPFNDDNLAKAIALLKTGAVIAHATETCYGFACDLSNPDAVKKLFAIKQRPDTQPVSALFASVDEAKKYVVWNERVEELARQYLPGPLTLILPMRPDAPTYLFPTASMAVKTCDSHVSTSLGIRISSSPVALALVTAFNLPLSTTSANLHGQPNPYCAKDIINQFANQEHQPDLILDSGLLPQVPPSTVINLATENTDTTVRAGTIKI